MSLDLDAVATFGEVDADADPLLEQSFEDHPAYIQARAHEKYVIIGRKGSGKTAIFRRMVNLEENDVYCYGHGFAEYPWHHHSKQIQVGVPKEHCFVQSWEYLINIILSKILLNKDQSQPWSDQALASMAKLETFVTDTYGSRDPDVSSIFSPTTTLKLKGEVGIDWKILKAKMAGETVSIEYLPIIVQEINKTLSEAVVSCANPEAHYYICFDELDLGFSLASEDYESRLIGLLLAARKLNIRARASAKNISVVVFLRDDIYQMLHFEDKNKLTEAAVTTIQWDVKGGSSLKALMEKRFHITLGIPEQGAWEAVFDEVERMTGKQSKYAHMIDRTFLRPRDIIHFSNDVLKAHRTKQDAGNQFSNIDIIAARREYSDYLLRELDDEIKKHHPDYGIYMEILKGVGSLQFTYDDIMKSCEDRKRIMPQGLTARDILARLYDYSVIGCYRPGGGGFGGADYVWKHKDRRSLFNENAASYRIHPGFMEVLGVKKFVRSS